MVFMHCRLPVRVYRMVYHAYTLFLFTKSDMKTIFFPIVSHHVLKNSVF